MEYGQKCRDHRPPHIEKQILDETRLPASGPNLRSSKTLLRNEESTLHLLQDLREIKVAWLSTITKRFLHREACSSANR